MMQQNPKTIGGWGSPFKMTESIDHPKHYTQHPSGIECIAVTRHMNFNLGNVVKYIWRAGKKGNRIQDLKKAEFYLKDEIQRLENEETQASYNSATSRRNG